MKYFGNMKQNSAAANAFDEVKKGTNYIINWNAELTWYFCVQIVEFAFMTWSTTRGFRFTWSCLIVSVFATWAKFLERLSYRNRINIIFNLCTKNICSCFCRVRALSKHVKNKFPQCCVLVSERL